MMVAFEDGVPEPGRVWASLDTLPIDKASRGSRCVLSSEPGDYHLCQARALNRTH